MAVTTKTIQPVGTTSGSARAGETESAQACRKASSVRFGRKSGRLTRSFRGG